MAANARLAAVMAYPDRDQSERMSALLARSTTGSLELTAPLVISRMLPATRLHRSPTAEVTATFTSEKVFEVYDGNRISTLLHVGRAG